MTLLGIRVMKFPVYPANFGIPKTSLTFPSLPFPWGAEKEGGGVETALPGSEAEEERVEKG